MEGERAQSRHIDSVTTATAFLPSWQLSPDSSCLRVPAARHVTHLNLFNCKPHRVTAPWDSVSFGTAFPGLSPCPPTPPTHIYHNLLCCAVLCPFDLQMDEILASTADQIKNFAVTYLVDISEVPDFNTMYELYDPCTTMFFFR